MKVSIRILPDSERGLSPSRGASTILPEVAALHDAEVEEAVIPKEDAEVDGEVDPNGDLWDDLDAEDADDPLMVSEYVVEIFEYLKEIEVRPFVSAFLWVSGVLTRASRRRTCRTPST